MKIILRVYLFLISELANKKLQNSSKTKFVILQISFSGLVFPALITAYCGQAAYLSKFPDHVAKTFYDSIPGKLLVTPNWVN